MKKILTAIVLLAASCGSHAFDRQEFISSCVEMYQDGTKAYQIARDEYGLRGEKADVLAYMIWSITTNADFLNYVYSRLNEEGFDLDEIKDRNKIVSLVVRTCLASFVDIVSNGMVRLSPEERRFFYEYSMNILKQLKSKREYEACLLQGLGNYGFTSADDLKRISRMIYRDISVSELRRFSDLALKALNAEIKDFPRRKALSASETIQAEKKYEELFISRLQRMPQKDIDRMINAFQNLDKVNAKDGCDAAILSIETALDGKGTAGDSILLYLLTQPR